MQKPFRLTVDIPKATHVGLKVEAARQSTTIRQLVLAALAAKGYPTPLAAVRNG